MSIFGSIFKGIKGVIGIGSGLLPGPIGTVARGGLSLLAGGVGQPVPRPQFSTQRPRLPPGSRTQFPTPGLQGRVQRFLPGGSTGFTTIPEALLPGLPRPTGPGGVLGGLGMLPGGATGFQQQQNGQVCAPRGFHLNKSSYFLRDGTFVPRGSKFVRNRSLNKSNGRANDRATSRLEKGQDAAKKLLRATGWRTISKQSTREIRTKGKATCK